MLVLSQAPEQGLEVGRNRCLELQGFVVDRVFDGSASAVMVSLFDCSEIDEGDVQELRRLFNRKIKEQRP